jgi:hypothetical protein
MTSAARHLDALETISGESNVRLSRDQAASWRNA